MPDHDENSLINSIKPLCNWEKSLRFPLGIGDDAAVRVCQKGEQLVYTGDTLVENIDFRLDWVSLDSVGEKAIQVNASDCAAMGAVPDSAIVQIVFPKKSNPENDIQLLYCGIQKSCKRLDIPVLGGDLSAGPCWMISVTMTGRAGKSDRLLYRNGAMPGDKVWVTGTPGCSGAGLALLQEYSLIDLVPRGDSDLLNAHISPMARIAEGRALASEKAVHSMIDVSDGIAKESVSIARASNCAIVLQLPHSLYLPELVHFCQLKHKQPDHFALYGGEDYELLFTAHADFDPASIRVAASCIGTVVSGSGNVILKNDEGVETAITQDWFDHLRV